MLVFSKFSTVEHNLLEKIVSKTISVERDLEAEFYKLYNETRLMLIAELEYLHPEFSREKSVHYAQLILNRYIFICFAEDLGLLPEDISVETIETTVNDHRLRGSEIWHDLNGLFFDVDKGNEDRENDEDKKIYGYNGGLFLEDIEFLKIRDIVEDQSIFNDADQKWNFKEQSLLVEDKLSQYSDKINPIYKNLMTISSFNFKSQLDVNILGHIFENSIGDIEELKADLKGRRKKDGIFYTPKDITDYICRNTIIPYLSKSGKATTVEKLVREYWGSEIKQLDEKVRNIKIVDPACGSGAFLNKASDVLLEIHEKIHEEKYKDDPTLIPYFDDIKERRSILLNNIYGVDLNEESVEITKLALFLKICKEGLKLPNLDNNIKCGNSLIDDPEYTDKPFKWEEKFPEIFNEGSFDIIVGNPPYGIFIDERERNYYSTHFPLTKYKTNLYILFIERMLQIFNNSIVHFIIPKSLLFNSYHGMIRKELLLKTEIDEIFTITEKVFDDAEVGSSLLLKFTLKDNPNPKNIIKLKTTEKVQDITTQSELKENNIPQEYFLSVPNYEISFVSDSSQGILTKLLKFKTIKDFYILKNGLNPGNIKHILISNTKETDFFKPIWRICEL